MGSLQFTLDGALLSAFDSDKARALLAYLAVESGDAHRREVLAGLLWPESPEKRARASLSQALYNLRSLLGDQGAPVPFLMVSREAIQFNPGCDYWLDSTAFTGLLSEVEAHDHRSLETCDLCAELLQGAVSFYRGDFLAGFTLPDTQAFQEWCLVTRERLHRQVVVALQQLAVIYEARGETDLALETTRRWIDIDPYAESAARRLMRLLDSQGQRTAALNCYQGFRRTLAEELGVEPASETTALYERLHSDQAETIHTKDGCQNLPEPVTPFIGRQRELSELQERLADPDYRLLTVVGPGGIGKTRLAIEVARSLVGRFNDGIYFVPLGAIESIGALVPALAQSLGFTIHEKRPPLEQVLDYLRQKDLLLVMDRFEGLLSGTDVVIEMLAAAPGLKILATSRLRLNVQPEQLYPLEGLEYLAGEHLDVATQSDAVQLFLSGAQRVQPSFALTEGNQSEVVAICRLVQGMPLAILLADAWVETLSLAEIHTEIRKNYDFLQADWADVPARQRSLRATFDYSWRLLSEREQQLYQRLTIFRGGFTREAAEKVTGISAQQLRALIGKSFLGRTRGERYDMHDMLRQYGAEQLAEDPGHDDYHTRHSDYYLEMLAQCEASLKRTPQQTILNQLDLEFGNLRAAWEWAVGLGQVERLEQAVEGLGLFYELRVRYQEGERACRLAAERIAAKQPVADQTRALIKIHTWQARFHRLQGNPELAHQLHERCLNHLDALAVEGRDDRAGRAFLLLEMGNTVYHTDLEAANRWNFESLELYRSIEDDPGTASALAGLGETALQSARIADSIAFYEESLTLFRALGDPRGIAGALTGLGGGLFRVGQLQEGEGCIRETIELFEKLDDRPGIARSQLNLGRAFFWQGKYDELTDLFEICAPVLKDLGMQYDRAYFLGLSTMANSHLGRYEQARLQAGESLPLCQEIEFPRMLGAAYLGLGMAALGRMEYSQARDHFQKALDAFIEAGLPEEPTTGIGSLGGAILKQGDLQLARQTLYEALQVSVEHKSSWGASWTLPWAALFLALRGDVERAVEVYAMANCLPMVAGSQWYAEFAEKDIMAAADSLPPQVVAAAQERGKEFDLFTTIEELLVELNPEQPTDA
jgi:predicted ATPase/DNA-binding SARP family transcriptional activator